MSVNIPCFWVTEWNGPTKPDTHNWCKENAKTMFPDNVTSFGIHTDDTFLFMRLFSDPTNNIDLVVHDNRSGTTAHIGFLPKNIFNIIG